MHTILKQQYPRKKILITNNAQDPVFGLPANVDQAEHCQQFDLILGHCSAGIHKLIGEIKYISCVRDPVKRLVSHYHYARQNENHYLYDRVNQKGFGFKDYVESDFSSEISNGMVRMLCGRLDSKTCQIDEEIYQETLRLIQEKFQFIATTERFDESLLVLQKEIGISTPYYARKKVGNYRKGEVEITDEILSIIHERNEFDQKIYEFVDEQLNFKADHFRVTKSKVDDFRQKNRKFGKWIHTARELRGRVLGGKVLNASTPRGKA